MGLKNSQYQAIMREYEKKQLRNHDIATARYEEVCDKIPTFRSLDDSICEYSVQYGRQLLNGDDQALSSLDQKLSALHEKKQALLSDAGFPADYLEPVYDCPDCKDTGYIGNEKCHCFKKAVSDLLYSQSNLNSLLADENFDTFSFDYHSSNYKDPKTGRSALDVIKEAYQAALDFVAAFGKDNRNLFLYGDVGVGKTFLSNCIAKALIDQGYSVLYFSAPSFFDVLAEGTFNREDSDAQNRMDYIFDCDLLIIDDLGTEMNNSFTVSQFFTCINERLLSKKSTIISTNLSLDSFADLYTERSFSRVTSNYIMLKLIGDDIRLKKKLQIREENVHVTKK